MATAAVTELPAVRDVRAILREFVNEFIAESIESGEVITQEAIDAAEERFTSDEEFTAAAVRDAIRAIVPDIVNSQVKRTGAWLTTERGAISNKRHEKTAREKLAAIFESVGPGRHKTLNVMVRPEILHALGERKTRVATELRRIKGLTEIVKVLPDDETPAGNLPAHTLSRILKEYFEPGE